MKARFIRETTIREDSVIHREGEVVDMDAVSFNRWARRGAVVEVSAAPAKPAAPAKSTTK